MVVAGIPEVRTFMRSGPSFWRARLIESGERSAAALPSFLI